MLNTNCTVFLLLTNEGKDYYSATDVETVMASLIISKDLADTTEDKQKVIESYFDAIKTVIRLF